MAWARGSEVWLESSGTYPPASEACGIKQEKLVAWSGDSEAHFRNEIVRLVAWTRNSEVWLNNSGTCALASEGCSDH